MVNDLTLIGRLGDDAVSEVRNGKHMTTWRMATGRDEHTQWHSCVAWEKTAEFAAGWKKGDLVFVKGEVRYRKWEDKYYTDVVAFRVLNLSGKKADPVFKGADRDDYQPQGESDELPF